MALSNTAVPKYYARFKHDVLDGLIPISREVALEMARIDKFILNPNYYFDDDAVEGWIRFCENEMTLTDGSDVVLLDSFKLWGEQLFGWYYYEEVEVFDPSVKKKIKKKIKHRLINKQFLIVGRGASKTVYQSYVQAYGLVIDKSTTHQITVAPTIRQSDEVLSTIRTSIVRARGPLFKFLTYGSIQNTTGNLMNRKKFTSTKEGIVNFITNSKLISEPLSIPKLQGLRCKYATIDEWLSGDIREDVIGAIEQGASKLRDYQIIAVSSEGTARNGVGDSIKMELTSILRGEYKNDHVSIWWYKLDDIKEVGQPEMWLKANPNIGVTVSWDTYQREVERAENVPSARNDILAKRFGIPTEGFTYFFTYNETLCHKKQNFWGLPCAMGADMSQGDDFESFSFLFPLRGGAFGIKTRNYISELTFERLPIALREKYLTFIDEDSLVVMPGAVLDTMSVYEELDQYIIKNEYDIRAFGFDPYNSKEFVERWGNENGQFGITKVIQGVKTESVPLGELKKLASERLLIFDQQIMKFTMGNCIALEDTNGNRKLYKKRREEKIDSVAATLDAYVAYKINMEVFD